MYLKNAGHIVHIMDELLDVSRPFLRHQRRVNRVGAFDAFTLKEERTHILSRSENSKTLTDKVEGPHCSPANREIEIQIEPGNRLDVTAIHNRLRGEKDAVLYFPSPKPSY